ncbi:MAG: hypothetical protein ACRD1T_27940 [Acidimicrobiia bacterium]
MPYRPFLDLKEAQADRYERQRRSDNAASPREPKPKEPGKPLKFSSTPIEWDSGITDDKDAPVAHGIIEIENGWAGTAGEGTSEHRHLSVKAGSVPDDPSQGLVVVLQFTPTGRGKDIHEYRTPRREGAVRVVAADGNLLTLESATGAQFVFDATRERFL